jgi:hypothetical protein
MEYNTVGLALRTLRCRLFGTTDVERWRDASEFSAWDERTRLIAGLIPEGSSSVIEFGAGASELKAHLKPSCSYTAADVIARSPETLVFDLNVRPLPALAGSSFDVAVFAGVLEYVADLQTFLSWLRPRARMVIASYECAMTHPFTVARLRETMSRLRRGWVNTLDEDALRALFGTHGYACVNRLLWHTPDGDEPIFVFEPVR